MSFDYSSARCSNSTFKARILEIKTGMVSYITYEIVDNEGVYGTIECDTKKEFDEERRKIGFDKVSYDRDRIIEKKIDGSTTFIRRGFNERDLDRLSQMDL